MNGGDQQQRVDSRHHPRTRWLWFGGWLVASIAVGFAAHTLNWRAVLVRLRSAAPGWIALAILGHFAILPLLTAEWSRLLPRRAKLNPGSLWDCVTIGMAAMNTLPFGGGHAVAVALLTARGIPMQGAVSLLALEQLCDGVAKLGLLLLAVAVVPLPARWHVAVGGLTAVILAGFAGLGWLARRPQPAGPGRRDTRTRRWRAALARHLSALRHPRVVAGAIGYSVLGRAAGLVAVYAVQRSLHVHLPLASVPVVFAAVTFATLVALSPGSLGVYEIAAVAAYRLFGVNPALAVTLAVLQHACFLIPHIGVGYAMVAWRALRGQRAPARPRHAS